MDNMIYITEENVEFLQNGKKNVLFGAGDYALNSLKFLQAHGITVDGILIDEAYLSSLGGQKSLENIGVFTFRAIPADSNFIFGISSISRWQQLQQEHPGLVVLPSMIHGDLSDGFQRSLSILLSESLCH